jgi:hypothetical protein
VLKSNRFAILGLLLAIPVASDAAPDGFWRPMRLEGGAVLVYELTSSRSLQNNTVRLTIEFEENLADSYHLKFDTLIDYQEQTHTERHVSDPFSWALEQIARGPVPPAQENLPLALTQDLVVSSMMLFYGVFKEPSEWEGGFSMPHPAPQLRGSRFVATAESCEEAGIRGKSMKVTRELESALACISPAHMLPLRLSKTSTEFGTQEYRLVSYRAKPLERKATFFQGEPDGFDGISWGTHVVEAEGLTLTGSPDEVTDLYERTDRSKRFWDARFDAVVYRFENRRFVGVVAKKRGPESWDDLLETLHRQYGSSAHLRSRLLDGVDEFVWSTGSTTRISIEYAGGERDITVIVRSLAAEGETSRDLPDDMLGSRNQAPRPESERISQ